MERHFLDDHVGPGKGQFAPEPWYNPYGDCIVYQIADEEVIADRIDQVLTIYLSAVDRRPIGFQIKGVLAIIEKFGWEGLLIDHLAEEGELEYVSVTAILLAAYESGPGTIHRRRAYAAALSNQPLAPRIQRRELVPA